MCLYNDVQTKLSLPSFMRVDVLAGSLWKLYVIRIKERGVPIFCTDPKLNLHVNMFWKELVVLTFTFISFVGARCITITSAINNNNYTKLYYILKNLLGVVPYLKYFISHTWLFPPSSLFYSVNFKSALGHTN